MDISRLSHGAKLVLGGTIAFLLLSFFSWFHYTGPGSDQAEALGVDTGFSMWHGVGYLAGLFAIALIVWQAIRLANIELEIGVTPSMVTAALAVLMALFAIIRFLDKPGGDFVGRTFWAWLAIALAIAVLVGAWLNMKAAGEGLSDIKGSLAAGAGAATAAAKSASAPKPDAAEPAAPAPSADDTSGAADEAADEAADATAAAPGAPPETAPATVTEAADVGAGGVDQAADAAADAADDAADDAPRP